MPEGTGVTASLSKAPYSPCPALTACRTVPPMNQAQLQRPGISSPGQSRPASAPRVRLAQYLLGLEGLALLRGWAIGDPHEADLRIGEIAGICYRISEAPSSGRVEMPELDVRRGYAAWAATYDQPTNPLIHNEEPHVRALLAECPPGRALDAACGTGRHAQYLAQLGHQVIGVDACPEMLAEARRKVPCATFLVGDLNALPAETASMDLAVCTLALTHCRNISPAIAELARVVRPGGRVILSDIHPTLVALGGQAFFQGTDGSFGIVRNYVHPVSTYLRAFAGAGLRVRACQEPPLVEDDLALIGIAAQVPGAASAALVGLPFTLIWDLERS